MTGQPKTVVISREEYSKLTNFVHYIEDQLYMIGWKTMTRRLTTNEVVSLAQEMKDERIKRERR